MSIEVHIDWQGTPHLVGRLHTAEWSPAVTFEYAREWLARDGAFALDPTGLPLGPGAIHGAALFGAMQDCGPDRWGRILIERAVRKQVLDRKPYREIDYVCALPHVTRLPLASAAMLPTAFRISEIQIKIGRGRRGPQAPALGLRDTSTQVGGGSTTED